MRALPRFCLPERLLTNAPVCRSCGIAVLVGLGLAIGAVRRTAAVGRVEYTVLFLMYAIVQGLQLADNSGLMQQGTVAISW